jgi:hypothetical protein
MTLLHGIDRDAAGAASMTATGTITYQVGVPITAPGELRTTSITGAPPAGSVLRHGMSFASDGTLQVTTDAIGQVSGGVAFTAAGVLCITTNAPANTSTQAFLRGLGVMVLVDTVGRVHVS